MALPQRNQIMSVMFVRAIHLIKLFVIFFYEIAVVLAIFVISCNFSLSFLLGW